MHASDAVLACLRMSDGAAGRGGGSGGCGAVVCPDETPYLEPICQARGAAGVQRFASASARAAVWRAAGAAGAAAGFLHEGGHGMCAPTGCRSVFLSAPAARADLRGAAQRAVDGALERAGLMELEEGRLLLALPSASATAVLGDMLLGADWRLVAELDTAALLRADVEAGGDPAPAALPAPLLLDAAPRLMTARAARAAAAAAAAALGGEAAAAAAEQAARAAGVFDASTWASLRVFALSSDARARCGEKGDSCGSASF